MIKSEKAVSAVFMALLRSVVPAMLGAVGAMVATLAPVHFSAFCSGVV